MFSKLLEDEDLGGSHVYTLAGGAHPHAGFRVEAEHAPARQPELSPVVLAIAEHGEDGVLRTTLTTFIG